MENIPPPPSQKRKKGNNKFQSNCYIKHNQKTVSTEASIETMISMSLSLPSVPGAQTKEANNKSKRGLCYLRLSWWFSHRSLPCVCRVSKTYFFWLSYISILTDIFLSSWCQKLISFSVLLLFFFFSIFDTWTCVFELIDRTDGMDGQQQTIAHWRLQLNSSSRWSAICAANGSDGGDGGDVLRRTARHWCR